MLEQHGASHQLPLRNLMQMNENIANHHNYQSKSAKKMSDKPYT